MNKQQASACADVQKNEKRTAMSLILLCWLVYSCSYIGKVNYSANINLIQEYFKIENYSTVGLAGTLFFFAYGIGQIVNGILCKKYNIKWIIFASLCTSGLINLAIPLMPVFAPIKYLWVINGFSMSILWPTLIRLLAQTMPKKYMAKASVTMGTTVAIGTFFVYGTSAVFALFTDFRAAFYTAAVVLLGVAMIWIFSVSKCVAALEAIKDQPTDEAVDVSVDTQKKTVDKHAIYLVICTLALCGIATNLIKDGLGTWVPSILKKMYELDNSLSIILTLALPIVSIFGNAFAVFMHKRISDFVYQCALMFFASGIIIAAVIGAVSLNSFVFTLVGFAAVSLLVSSCNSLITSIFPLFMKGKLNSGLIAGVLNGFCYVGSTLSTYALGSVADRSGWMAVFWVLLFVCVAVVAIAAAYSLVRKFVIKIGFMHRDE